MTPCRAHVKNRTPSENLLLHSCNARRIHCDYREHRRCSHAVVHISHVLQWVDDSWYHTGARVCAVYYCALYVCKWCDPFLLQRATLQTFAAACMWTDMVWSHVAVVCTCRRFDVYACAPWTIATVVLCWVNFHTFITTLAWEFLGYRNKLRQYTSTRKTHVWW